MEEIFKAYDIRGKVGTELTVELCENIGRAFADWLPEEGIVAVGRDMRGDSEELASSVITGLRLQGREVYDLGQITTDMLYFAVGNLKLAGGAMITASHNPGDYNGIKLCREEAKPIGIESGLAEIRDSSLQADFVSAGKEGKVKFVDVSDGWIKHVLSFVSVQNWPEYRIAVDAGNGMAGAIFPKLDNLTPLKVTPLYFELDGTFPNHLANPLDDSTLVDIQKTIQENNLDFGIAFDADGDRARLLDEKGQPVSGTIMTAILAKYFLSREPGSVILYNAICGKIVPEVVEANGGTAVRTKVGHSFIKADMREEDAIFAGEHSGHYFFRDNYNADSGLIAAVIAIQVLAESGKKMSELVAEFDKYYAIPEKNFEVQNKKAMIQKISQAFTGGEQDWLDGLTVTMEDAWFNVRPSNTEPLLRFNAEATTKERLDGISNKISNFIEENQ